MGEVAGSGLSIQTELHARVLLIGIEELELSFGGHTCMVTGGCDAVG